MFPIFQYKNFVMLRRITKPELEKDNNEIRMICIVHTKWYGGFQN